MPSRPGRSKHRSAPSSARGKNAKTPAADKAIPAATVALSRALREARVNAKLNQTDAARKIGVHFVTVYAWENEKRNDQPSDANLARAAKAYRTTAEDVKRRAAAIERTLGAGKSDVVAGSRGAAKPDLGTVEEREVPVKPLPVPNVIPATGARAAADAGSSKAGAKRAPKAAASARPSPRTVVTSPRPISSDRAIVSKVLRVLADVADKVPLTPETLNAAQRALLAPALIDLFAAFKSGPMSDDDINAAYDATGAAVVGFVERRVLPA